MCNNYKCNHNNIWMVQFDHLVSLMKHKNEISKKERKGREIFSIKLFSFYRYLYNSNQWKTSFIIASKNRLNCLMISLFIFAYLFYSLIFLSHLLQVLSLSYLDTHNNHRTIKINGIVTNNTYTFSCCVFLSRPSKFLTSSLFSFRSQNHCYFNFICLVMHQFL